MKRLVVLGAGESGVGTAILAQKKGYDVFVSDFGVIQKKYCNTLIEKGIEYEENGHTKSKILNADLVVKSPGISDNVAIVQEILKRNIEIISEIEFAGQFTDAKMICITGSNGKTTTASLIYHIFKKEGLNVGLAGNIGNSFARQVAECDFDYYVLELSSFQLDGMKKFKADIAILLNITPDHLDRYNNDFQKYIDSKFRIIQNQTEKDAFIFWNEDERIKRELQRKKIKSSLYPFAINGSDKIKAFIENEQLIINILKKEIIMPVKEISIKGTHNMLNSMATGLAASLSNIKKENIRKSLQDFRGVEHRLEYVATVRDVVYVNDSKATNINSCWYALQTINTSTVLILGGEDKGNDYSEIEELVKEKVSTLIFLGKDNSKLHHFFDGKVEKIFDATSMKECVDIAYKVAKGNETVLLSPACASFDLFKNYEDRGKQFCQCVRNL